MHNDKACNWQFTSTKKVNKPTLGTAPNLRLADIPRQWRIVAVKFPSPWRVLSLTHYQQHMAVITQGGVWRVVAATLERTDCGLAWRWEAGGGTPPTR